MTTPSINLFQLNDSTSTTNLSRGFKLSSSEVASKKLMEYFGNLGYQSNKNCNENSTTSKMRKVFDEVGAYFDNKTMSVKCAPGRYTSQNGNQITTVNDNGLVTKVEFYSNDPKKKFSIETDYSDDKVTDTYKDNNGNVKFSEERSKEPDYKDKDNNTVTTVKTTVKDAKGNILYIKIKKTTTAFETTGRNSYQANHENEITYQDSNGIEISREEALARRNKHCTQSMLESLEKGDNFEEIQDA